MSNLEPMTLDAADYRNAMTEVSFLLDILAATVDDLMGGATVSVGRIAGRHQARRLPIYLDTPNVGELVVALNRTGQLGVDFDFAKEHSTFHFRHCAVREVCRVRQVPLGGNLCRLYHFYLDGILNEFLLRPTRSTVTATGDSCQARLEVR